MGLQHPDITKMMRDGTLAKDEPPKIECHVCGKECEIFYKADTEVIGCENCIKSVDAEAELYG